jgi:hypothetical protein
MAVAVVVVCTASAVLWLVLLEVKAVMVEGVMELLLILQEALLSRGNQEFLTLAVVEGGLEVLQELLLVAVVMVVQVLLLCDISEQLLVAEERLQAAQVAQPGIRSIVLLPLVVAL